MPYQNIPETGIDAAISKAIGKLKGDFEQSVKTSLESIKSKFDNGCPSVEEQQEVERTINNLKAISTQINTRLNKFKKLPTPLRAGATGLTATITAFKLIPNSPFTLPGLVADGLTLVKETATQLSTTANSIDFALNQSQTLTKLLQETANTSQRVEIALQFCELCNEENIECPADCIRTIVRGTEQEAGECINKLNDLFSTDLKNSLESINDKKTKDIQDQGRETYTGPDGTVYTLRIIQIESEYTRALLRQAIAENSYGIIKFKSSKSYSSSTDVLKDEVKFIIDNSQV